MMNTATRRLLQGISKCPGSVRLSLLNPNLVNHSHVASMYSNVLDNRINCNQRLLSLSYSVTFELQQRLIRTNNPQAVVSNTEIVGLSLVNKTSSGVNIVSSQNGLMKTFSRDNLLCPDNSVFGKRLYSSFLCNPHNGSRNSAILANYLPNSTSLNFMPRMNFIKSDYDPSNEKSLSNFDKEKEIRGYFKEDFNVLGHNFWKAKFVPLCFIMIFTTLSAGTALWVYLLINTEGADFWLEKFFSVAITQFWANIFGETNPKLLMGLCLWTCLQAGVFLVTRSLNKVIFYILVKSKIFPQAKYARFKNETDYHDDDRGPI